MKLIKSALGVALHTILSRATGYFRDVLMAKFIGTSMVMDALVIAIKVPSFLRRIFGEGALNSSFIPIFSSLLIEDQEKAKAFLNHVLSLMLGVLVVLVIAFEILMPALLSFVFQKSTKEFIDLIVFFSRITFPFILFISLTALFSGVLNSYERFAAAASSQIGGNCFIIFVMLMVNPIHLAQGRDVALAVMGSGIVQLIWVLIPCLLVGIRPRLVRVRLSDDIRRFGKRMIPAAFGAGVLQLNLLVDMYIATYLGGGTNSYLYYADRLYQLPISVIGTAMGTVLLPLLTRLWRENKPQEASYTQNRAIEFTLLTTIPAMLCLYFLSESMVRISFQRGAFDLQATYAVTQTVIGFTFGLPAYVLVKIFNSSFFARQNTLTPTLVAVGVMFLNLILNLILMQTYRHFGIALATAIASWANVLILGCLLLYKKEFVIDRKLMLSVLKIFVSFFITYAVFRWLKAAYIDSLFLVSKESHLPELQGLILSVGIIFGGYFGLMWCMRGLSFREYL